MLNEYGPVENERGASPSSETSSGDAGLDLHEDAGQRTKHFNLDRVAIIELRHALHLFKRHDVPCFEPVSRLVQANNHSFGCLCDHLNVGGDGQLTVRVLDHKAFPEVTKYTAACAPAGSEEESVSGQKRGVGVGRQTRRMVWMEYPVAALTLWSWLKRFDM